MHSAYVTIFQQGTISKIRNAYSLFIESP